MATLANFPIVSQLTQVTSDGRPSENSQFDCVPASIGAAILWFQGKHQWDQEVNPDRMKDVAYGEALRNSGTAASAYVDFCKSLGIHLYPVETPDYAHAVQAVHQHIREQKPVIFTRDDPYVDQSIHPDWTHVCVFFSEDGSGLTALDPYIGKPVYKTDAGWANILRNSELWLTERIDDVITIDLTTPGVSGWFESASADGHVWRCKSNGKIVQFGILDAYRKWGNAALCGLTFLGLPASNEIPLPGVPGAVKQHFERGVLFYDPGHKIDTPPGAGGVYAAHLYDGGSGQDPRIAELQAQVADLEKQLAANPGNATVQQQLDAANQKLAQVKALVG